ncbi:MAG: hypothetical protein HC834_01780 [Rhodospirillales bacterium]|nr:hypothetical protein [Rhodospirillales bacterium]
MPPKARPALFLRDADQVAQERLARYRELILALSRVESVELAGKDMPSGVVQDIVDGTTVLLQVADVIDVGAEQLRLAKEITRLDNEVARVDRKLANAGFLAKAPPELVEGEREKKEEAVVARARLEEATRRLAKL